MNRGIRSDCGHGFRVKTDRWTQWYDVAGIAVPILLQFEIPECEVSMRLSVGNAMILRALLDEAIEESEGD